MIDQYFADRPSYTLLEQLRSRPDVNLSVPPADTDIGNFDALLNDL